MNKTELAEALATQVGLSKKAAKEAVDSLFETIGKTMCDGEPVRITGFGTFKPVARGSRRNPKTGGRIGPRAAPKINFSTELKDMVRKKLKVVESSGELSLVKAV